MKPTLLAATVALAACTAGAEPDIATLYEVSTEGTTTSLKAGESGKFVVSITARAGAHVSDEAPLRIEVSSKELKLDKQKLTLADSVVKKKAGSSEYPNPRFEVTFTPSAQGKAVIEAKMVFFICTDKVCARQTKNLNTPVDITVAVPVEVR